MSPRAITVGRNTLLLTDEQFLNGYQAGHLAYMAYGREMQFSDTSLKDMLMEILESMAFSEAYSFGYVVGWLVTFAGKEPKTPATSASMRSEGL
jgi:hypothetical protein